MRENGRFAVCMVLLAMILSSFSITHVSGSSETQATTAQASPPFFDITILDDELVNKSVQSLAFDSMNNHLYVGTMQGLSIVDVNNLSVTNLTKTDGLAGNNILGLDYDSVGNRVFMGFVEIPYSYPDKRLSIYNQSNGIFTNFGPYEGLNSGVRCLSFDGLRNWLFIGTDGKGLNILNITSHIITYRNYTHGLPGNGIVWSLELDEMNNKLYVGTSEGLAIYDIVNDTIEVRDTDDGLVDNYVFNMNLDETNQILYIGTWDPYLSVYDIQNDIFTNHSTGGRSIADFALDSATGFLYIAGVDAVFVFNTLENKFSEFMLDANDFIPLYVVSLYWDSTNNILFVGSDRNGLGIYDPYYVDTPSISSSESIDKDGNHTIQWENVDRAEWYILERAYSSNFSESSIVYSGNNTENTFHNISEGIHWYRVRGNNSIRIGEWSEPISVTVVVPPGKSEITNLEYIREKNQIIVEWESIAEADNYILEERCSTNKSDWYIVYNGTGNSVLLNNRSTGIYEYRVRTHNTAGYSEYSELSYIDTLVAQPRASEITFIGYARENNHIIVEWEEIPEAENYILEERCRTNNSDWYMVYAGSSNSVILKNRPAGFYEYRVRASNAAGLGDYSSVKSIDTAQSPIFDSNTMLMLAAVAIALVICMMTFIIVKRQRLKKTREKDKEIMEEVK